MTEWRDEQSGLTLAGLATLVMVLAAILLLFYLGGSQ
jgi:ATP adenylyltransferase/5',5'''-P-1,P-4-tetraphosphate phosphorylase II